VPSTELPSGLRSSEVCRLLGLPSSTLNYWVQIGLVRPTIRGPQGRRVEQYWSVADVVVVRSVRELRRSGASLQQVRRAVKRLTNIGVGIASARLYWDGKDVIVQTDTGDFVSGLERPGQLVWFLTALPLKKWYAEADRWSTPVELDVLKDRDRVRAERQKTTAVPLSQLVRRRTKSA
jgi:DNA-binding transcriptional MerR regulator